MRFLLLLVALVVATLASSAFAQTSRFEPLLNSSLISSLETNGSWRVTETGNLLNYKCLQCDAPVTATIEITVPYSFEGYPNFKEKYLTERKAFCAELVTELRGRCVRTDETAFRSGLPRGFRSTHEIDDQQITEIVFYYYNDIWGSSHGMELIKGTVSQSLQDATSSGDIAGFLPHHMFRLTLFY